MKRYVAILSGMGDVQYNIMTKEQWDADVSDFNDYCLNMLTQEDYDEDPHMYSDDATIVEFVTMDHKDYLKYIQANDIEIVDVFDGYIY